jgi:hypothetical protein
MGYLALSLRLSYIFYEMYYNPFESNEERCDVCLPFCTPSGSVLLHGSSDNWQWRDRLAQFPANVTTDFNQLPFGGQSTSVGHRFWVNFCGSRLGHVAEGTRLGQVLTAPNND